MSILALQALYAAAAIAFNLVSLGRARRGGAPLTPNDPRRALILLAVYVLALGVGAAGLQLLYRVLMAAFAAVLGATGVVRHLARARDLLGYPSRATWLLAIALNLVGLALNVAAATGVAQRPLAASQAAPSLAPHDAISLVLAAPLHAGRAAVGA